MFFLTLAEWNNCQKKKKCIKNISNVFGLFLSSDIFLCGRLHYRTIFNRQKRFVFQIIFQILFILCIRFALRNLSGKLVCCEIFIYEMPLLLRVRFKFMTSMDSHSINRHITGIKTYSALGYVLKIRVFLTMRFLNIMYYRWGTLIGLRSDL